MRPLKRAANCRTFRQDMFVPGRTSRPSTTFRKQERRLISNIELHLPIHLISNSNAHRTNQESIHRTSNRPTISQAGARIIDKTISISLFLMIHPHSGIPRHPHSSALPPIAGRRCAREEGGPSRENGRESKGRGRVKGGKKGGVEVRQKWEWVEKGGAGASSTYCDMDWLVRSLARGSMRT